LTFGPGAWGLISGFGRCCGTGPCMGCSFGFAISTGPFAISRTTRKTHARTERASLSPRRDLLPPVAMASLTSTPTTCANEICTVDERRVSRSRSSGLADPISATSPTPTRPCASFTKRSTSASTSSTTPASSTTPGSEEAHERAGGAHAGDKGWVGAESWRECMSSPSRCEPGMWRALRQDDAWLLFTAPIVTEPASIVRAGVDSSGSSRCSASFPFAARIAGREVCALPYATCADGAL
jgi:hypothetical protein